MTYLIIFRLVTDYFWSFKALSVMHSIIAAALLAMRLKTGLVAGLVLSDVIVLFFSIILVFNYTVYFEGNTIDFLKLMCVGLFYFLGRFSRFDNIYYNIMAIFSMFSIILLLFLSIAGLGYVDWGNYSTFTGGYYFKTDLALAVIIFFTFSVSYYIDKSLIVSLAICLISVWLVWISNARISIVALVLSIGVIGYLKFRYLGMLPIFLGFLVLVAFSIFGLLILEASDDLLGFDFSDFFGEANLQGRNWIWLSLLKYYDEYDLFSKFFGGGLHADVLATSKYSLAFNLDESRAHNSFLYVLLCMGGVGLFLFSSLLLNWIYVIFRAMKGEPEPLLIICVCLFVIFFIFSFTTEAIIRAQIIVPLSFFMGRLILMTKGVKGL